MKNGHGFRGYFIEKRCVLIKAVMGDLSFLTKKGSYLEKLNTKHLHKV